MADNSFLNNARIKKQDDFITSYDDIEKELRIYKDSFEGKVIYCNCNDIGSNFFRYLLRHFNEFKIKKLVATSYKENKFDKASKVMIQRVIDYGTNCYCPRNDFSIHFDGVYNTFENLNGNGDFNSQECVDILKESDIIISNPPFSKWREYFNLINKYNKSYIILGNINAITYRDVFNLIRDNKCRLGYTIHCGDREFRVPNYYEIKTNNSRIDEYGNKYVRVSGIRWFTNIDYKEYNKNLPLTKSFTNNDYRKFDNFNAINIDKTIDIPYNYYGIMGVPITFLDKYNPEQFEIIGFTANVGRPDFFDENVDMRAFVDGKEKYKRLLILNKRRIND